MSKPKRGYLVMRATKELRAKDIHGREFEIEPADDIHAYVPIYTNKRKATKATEKGKYPMYEISIGKSEVGDE